MLCWFLFSVLAKLLSISASVTYLEDDDVVLVCTAEGYPTPHVTWIAPNGTVLQNRTTDTNLTLPNVSRHSSGTYQCNATNELGSDSATAKLDVLCKFLSFTYCFFSQIWKTLWLSNLVNYCFACHTKSAVS